jgi:hypothetical protein
VEFIFLQKIETLNRGSSPFSFFACSIISPTVTNVLPKGLCRITLSNILSIFSGIFILRFFEKFSALWRKASSGWSVYV